MITVVFATHNGSETLKKTLESMEQLVAPGGGWKLIAVDNASTDNTADIIESFSNKLPLLILYQPRRGKNVSLNMAISYFEGDLIVFTDDDVIPMPNWLVAYEELAKAHPECTVFGGQIVPHWPGHPPEEIMNAIPLGAAYAVHPQNMLDGPVNTGMIWGPNMAVRKLIFDAGYRFNENIGPTAGNYIQGSEVEFTHRLKNDGFRNWFSREIAVKHQIMDYQLTSKWLWGRALRYGRGKYIMKSKFASNGTDVAMFFGLPRWQVWQLVKDMSFFPFSLFKRNRTQYFRLIWRIGLNYSILKNIIKKKIN